MKKIFALALGLIAAVGGFIDIGDFVFASQAGAKFGYSLLWALVVGTIGILIYAEMSGRVAAIAKMSVFDIIRKKYPPKLGFATLVLSLLVIFMSCAADVGGVALVMALLAGFSYQLLIPVAVLLLVGLYWFVPFEGIERIFGYLGIGMVIMLVVAIKTLPGVRELGTGLIPHHLGASTLSYWYFAVGVIAATLNPYEVYFYASGGIEQRWNKKKLFENSFNAYAGFGLGAILVAGIIIASANVLLPRGISPGFIGTPLLPVLGSLGQIGLLIALLGLLFTIGGAVVETSFSGAYNLAQYAGWKWGKRFNPRDVPYFTATWVTFVILGGLVVLTGIDPVQLTEYGVIFAAVVMPLTYYPILKTAKDKLQMGSYANGKIMNALGYLYLGIIIIVSLASVPLMLLTHQGKL
jgi:Mn2+/Fe2+ NRAMP family transporter